jgi:hypothetical protein
MYYKSVSKSIPVVRNKRGRPPTGQDRVTAVRLSAALRSQIEEWGKQQPDKPSRSGALRRLVEIALMLAPTMGLERQLLPPLPEEPDDFRPLKQAIVQMISSHMPKLEELAGLQEPNSQLRNEVAEVILLCILTHKFPPKRHSETRKQLLALSGEAASAAEISRRLVSTLAETSGIYPPIKRRYLELFGNQIEQYVTFAKLARGHGNSLTDRGGQRGMLGFRLLVELLCAAFEKVTGRKVSEAARYRGEKQGHEGIYFDFVDAVLSLVRKLAPDMPCPESRLAQDTYVLKVITSRETE